MFNATIENEDTGGGFVATLITLADGRILVTSNVDEGCALYASREAWDDSEATAEYADLTSAIEALNG